MNKSSAYSNHMFQMIMAILIMSSSGTLGRYIDFAPPVTIWFRCVIGGLALFGFLHFTKAPIFIGWGQAFGKIVISSVLMAGHWVTYFYALKYSNVAIGMLSLFTYPVVTALLEPMMLKTKWKISDLILAAFAFAGVFFLVPGFDLKDDLTVGILFGLASSLFYSIRNIMLKKDIAQISGVVLMYYQVVIIGILLLPALFIFPGEYQEVISDQWSVILFLGLITTSLGHTLFVKSFKHFTVTTVSVISCLTPLFGILIGFLFLNEVPTDRVYLGGGTILIAVLVESYRSIKS